jgi:hypothetical protein
MPPRMKVPVAPGVQPGSSGRDNRAGGRPRVVGTVIAVVIAALLLLLVLPIGGLVVISLGVYIGVLARRARALTVVGRSTHGNPEQNGEPLTDATPSSPAVRKFLGLTPSYGLSAVLTAVGILMFIAGIALFSAPNAPANQIASPNRDPAAPAALPTVASPSSEPAFAAPPADSTLPSRQPQLVQDPAEQAGQPVATRPATPKPAAQPRPTLPQPVATQPNSPEPAAAPPAAPPPADSDGGATYYKNCAAARAAGAAPLHSGDPGYRPELDSDRDGIACER